MRLLLVVLLLAAGCTVDTGRAPAGGAVADPSPEQVARALRFAALALLPPGARVPRLEVQGGIDTRVALVVVVDGTAAGPWLTASGVPAAPPGGAVPQQRLANPDGAVVYRDVAVGVPAADGTVSVDVTAFTT